ncbi:MAG: COQ9 family protein [Dongiaceae bacterium]
MTGTSENEDRRDALLLAVLRHVPFDGWTRRAIHAGAEELGLDAARADNLLPGGPAEAMALFHNWADRQMLAALVREAPGDMRIRDKAALALKLRLRVCAPFRETVRQGVAFLAQPHHATLGAKLTWRTVDAIWHALGDRAADFNYYTKRGLLAGVYASSAMYWLADRSPDSSATEAFIDRRIDEVMQVPKLMSRLRQQAEKLPNPFKLFRRPRGSRSYRGY